MPPGTGPLRISDLVPRAHRLPDGEFLVSLGRPRALLVGPGCEADSPEGSRDTRASTPSPRALRVSEFTEHLVYPLPERSERGAPIRIGRAAGNDILVVDDSISKFHAQLRPLGDRDYSVEDLRSLNGTIVDGALVLPGRTVRLSPGQTLQLGSRTFKLYDPLRLRKTLRTVVPERGSPS